MASNLPPKKQVAIALLERSSVFIHLDPRKDGVVVPGWLKNRAQLVLQIGLNMPVRIPDLDVDESAVSCTLSFNRAAHFCHVPWSAVYALVGEDGRGMVWPEDVPPEVADQSSGAATGNGRLRPVPPPDRVASVESDATAGGLVAEPEPLQKRPSLVPIAAGSEDAPKRGVGRAVGQAGRREMPSYLRLVK